MKAVKPTGAAPWSRPDHYDPRDPWAPKVWACACCDLSRDGETAWCSDCREVTPGYVGTGRPVGGSYQSTRPVAEMGFRRDAHGMITLDEDLAA